MHTKSAGDARDTAEHAGRQLSLWGGPSHEETTTRQPADLLTVHHCGAAAVDVRLDDLGGGTGLGDDLQEQKPGGRV